MVSFQEPITVAKLTLKNQRSGQLKIQPKILQLFLDKIPEILQL
jgi:hypothetical protein